MSAPVSTDSKARYEKTKSPRPSKDSPFTEIARLRDPDDLGLVAPITIKTKPNGYVAFSFAIFKEFEGASGQAKRTSFLNDRHIDAAHKLLDAVEKRIEIERDRVRASRRTDAG